MTHHLVADLEECAMVSQLHWNAQPIRFESSLLFFLFDWGNLSSYFSNSINMVDIENS